MNVKADSTRKSDGMKPLKSSDGDAEVLRMTNEGTIGRVMTAASNGGDEAPSSNGKPLWKQKSKLKKQKRKERLKTNELLREKKEEEEELMELTQSELNLEIDYVPDSQETLHLVTDPVYSEYAKIFEKFQGSTNDEEVMGRKMTVPTEFLHKEEPDEAGKNEQKEEEDDEEDEGNEETEVSRDSRKKRKKLRMNVAELKQLVKRSEMVEWVDVTATDPLFLVHLKSIKNVVPVPQHWLQKRKYLQGKRGIAKPPFELPGFIRATGITELRESGKEKELEQSSKQKARAKVQPKMGKIEIDYQKLHDAFFRYQTKPLMTRQGDLYHEGKEHEVKMKESRPGTLSDQLKNALNIPPLAPPPWLIHMQRWGPPPAYPNLRIPGLNAPIPIGAQWGFHPGGWGKPPVDEYGRPLYGDVFGTHIPPPPPSEFVQPIERVTWGDLTELSYGAEEEIEEEDEEEPEEEITEESEEFPGISPTIKKETTIEAMKEGLITPSGLSSIPAGLETPDDIELRKDQRRTTTSLATDSSGTSKQLYRVLQEKESKGSSGFLGSAYTYEMAQKSFEMVELSIRPEDLASLDEATLKSRYTEALKTQHPEMKHEDLRDMVSEHIRKSEKKRRSIEETKSKRHKEFKF